MMLRGAEEDVELIGVPDSARFDVAIARALRAVGWISWKQLVDMDCICECLPQGAVYVRNGPCRQWPSVVTAVAGQVAVEL